jgi:hypothetical protein
VSGGADIIAVSTHFRCYLEYNSSAGTNWTGFRIVKIKAEKDQYGYPIREWEVTLSPWSMSEEDNSRFSEAAEELGLEIKSLHGFDKLTAEQKTLSDIWAAFKEAEHNVWVWKSRAEQAEKALNGLHNIWYELEERKHREAKESEALQGGKE